MKKKPYHNNLMPFAGLSNENRKKTGVFGGAGTVRGGIPLPRARCSDKNAPAVSAEARGKIGRKDNETVVSRPSGGRVCAGAAGLRSPHRRGNAA